MSNSNAKQVIKEYLEKRAASDPQFAASYAKPTKNIDECFKYILGEARNHGSQVCLTDEEVFGLAVHYYDEDNLKIKYSCRAEVSTSRNPSPVVKLTGKEKAAAKEEALRLYQRECIAEFEAREKAAKKKKRSAAAVEESPSLFDGLGL